MNITLHFIENERWMEIMTQNDQGKDESFFGKPGRWHKIGDEMKYITSNSDINQLDRVFFVAEARMLYQECKKNIPREVVAETAPEKPAAKATARKGK